jgi:hypothetical protein
MVALTPATGNALRTTHIVSDCEKPNKEHSEQNRISAHFIMA